MKKSLYTFTGIVAGLAIGGLLLIPAFFIFLTVFGLMLFGDSTSGFASNGFYVVLFAVPIVSAVVGGAIGSRRGRNESEAHMGKAVVILLVSFLVIGSEAYLWSSFNDNYRAPSVDSGSAISLAELISAPKGTYTVQAAIKELSTDCFCPSDVSCSECADVSSAYIILQDGDSTLKAFLSFTSKYSVDDLPSAKEFVIEKHEYTNSTFYYLFGFR